MLQRIVTSGSQSSVNVTSLSQAYTDLRIVISGRDTSSSGFLTVRLQLNGDTSSGNYTNSIYLEGNASSVNNGTQSATSAGVIVGYIPGSASSAQAVGKVEILIPNYSGTTFQKHFDALATGIIDNSGSTGNTALDLRTGRWLSTAAVTSFLITAGGTAFVDGTTITVYGCGPIAGSAGPNVSSIYPALTVPTAASFSSTFGTMTLTDKSDRLQVIVPSGSALRGASRSLGSTPWTIDMAVMFNAAQPTGNACAAGIQINDGTKLIGWYPGLFSGTSIRDEIDEWNNASSFNTSLLGEANLSIPTGLLFLRITNDGTNRRYYRSSNGKDFVLLFTHASGTFLTENSCGIAFYNDSTRSLDSKAAVLNFTVTNSVLGDGA